MVVRRPLVIAALFLVLAPTALRAADPAPVPTEIISATWGSGSDRVDVTRRLLDEVAGGELRFQATARHLGDTGAGVDKTLIVVYRENGQMKTSEFKSGQVLVLANVQVPIVKGLQITRATWGSGANLVDVKDKLSSLIKDNKLALVANDETLGAAAATALLRVSYVFDGKVGALIVRKNNPLTLPPPAPPVAATLPAAPILTITRATYGANGKTVDVTAKLVALIDNNKLAIIANNALFGGDPAPNSPKELVITFQYNRRNQTLRFNEGAAVTLPAPAPVAAAPSVPVTPARGPTIPTPSTPAPAVDVLKITSARWGPPDKQKDVLPTLTAKLHDNKLEAWANNNFFSTPDGDVREKNLDVTWEFSGKSYSAHFMGDSAILIAPPDSADLETLAQLRKTKPAGLVVVRARWGRQDESRSWEDVTQIVRNAVAANSLTVQVTPPSFGKDWSNSYGLQVFYDLGKGLQITAAPDAETLQIGPDVTTFLVDKTLVPVAKALAEGRAAHGDSLFIINARWGNSRFADVTDKLQARIADNRLFMQIDNNTLGDPSGGRDNTLSLIYFDGAAVKSTTIKANNRLGITGSLPQALARLQPLPDYLAEGRPLSHNFAVTGLYKLLSGPAGATLSPDGHLSWTPTADQIGPQPFQFTIVAAGKTFTQLHTPIVIDKTTAAAANGDPKKLAALMRLDFTTDTPQYLPALDGSDALLLEKDQLTITAPDGASVVKKIVLPHPYVRVAERKAYFVAIRLDPMVMDLLDKNTGKVLKTIKLQYRRFHDLVLLPDRNVAFIAVDFADSVPHDRLIAIMEDSGEVRELKDMMATFLSIDRAGKSLWAGVKDLYVNGSEFFINPDWRIYETPTYGSIDLLLRYNLGNGEIGLAAHNASVGANGSAVKVSPDGKRVTYLSFTGFPRYSKNIAAWDAHDFDKKPVIYEIKDKNHGAAPLGLAFHPVLPLVAIPLEEGGVLVFDRESGDEQPARVSVNPSLFAGGVTKTAYFSPDGLSIILQCVRGTSGFLYKVPLTLSVDERAAIKKGLLALPIEPAPGRTTPSVLPKGTLRI
jgi:hypothetical protein